MERKGRGAAEDIPGALGAGERGPVLAGRHADSERVGRLLSAAVGGGLGRAHQVAGGAREAGPFHRVFSRLDVICKCRRGLLQNLGRQAGQLGCAQAGPSAVQHLLLERRPADRGRFKKRVCSRIFSPGGEDVRVPGERGG